jgi:hypothetical protein
LDIKKKKEKHADEDEDPNGNSRNRKFICMWRLSGLVLIF